MTIRVVRRDPLEGCGNKEQIMEYINVLKDPDITYQQFTHAAGWLRGARTVLNSNDKTKRAADFIQSVLRKVKHADDTELAE